MEKFSVRIDGLCTSITIEPLFRRELEHASDALGIAPAELIRRIAKLSTEDNLSSEIRCWLLSERVRECDKLRKMLRAQSALVSRSKPQSRGEGSQPAKRALRQ